MNKYLKFLIVVLLDISLIWLILTTGYTDSEVCGNILTFVLFVLNAMFLLVSVIHSKSVFDTNEKKHELLDSYNSQLKLSKYWSIMSTIIICLCLAGIGWVYWACFYFVMYFLGLGSREGTVAAFKKELED